MDIKECYDRLGGSYENVLRRLRSAKLIERFVVKFLSDKNYELLCQSLENHDFETAFRAVHTLKGICLNLEFSRLYASSLKLTEALRSGEEANLSRLLTAVTEDYFQTKTAILSLEQNG